MKTKLLLPLLALPLCGLGEALPFERDYTMVDLGNGLITKLLDVGTTSITFSVEWTPNVEIDHRWLSLMGKLDIEERGWHFLTSLEVDHTQDQGKVIFEVPYTDFSWHNPPEDLQEKFKVFEKKAFFAIRVPLPVDSLYDPGWGKYEKDDETDIDIFDENWWKPGAEAILAETSQTKQDGGQVSSPNHEEKLEVRNEELGEEELGIEKQEPPNRLWLYLAVLPFILAILYLMRKKKS